jgi:hypothetical protein
LRSRTRQTRSLEQAMKPIACRRQCAKPQSIFLAEDSAKRTVACPVGGQIVSHNNLETRMRSSRLDGGVIERGCGGENSTAPTPDASLTDAAQSDPTRLPRPGFGDDGRISVSGASICVKPFRGRTFDRRGSTFHVKRRTAGFRAFAAMGARCRAGTGFSSTASASVTPPSPTPAPSEKSPSCARAPARRQSSSARRANNPPPAPAERR